MVGVATPFSNWAVRAACSSAKSFISCNKDFLALRWGISTLRFSVSINAMMRSYSSGVTVRVTFFPVKSRRSSNSFVIRARSAAATSSSLSFSLSLAAWMLSRVRWSPLRIAVRIMFSSPNKSRVLVSSFSGTAATFETCFSSILAATGADTASSGFSAMPGILGGVTSCVSALGIGASSSVNKERVCPRSVRLACFSAKALRRISISAAAFSRSALSSLSLAKALSAAS